MTIRDGDVLKKAIGPDGDSVSRVAEETLSHLPSKAEGAKASRPSSPGFETNTGEKEINSSKKWISEGKEVRPPPPDYKGIKPANPERPKPKADGTPGENKSQTPKKWIPEEREVPPPPPDYNGIKPANPESPKPKTDDPGEKESQAHKKWISEERKVLPLPPDYKGHRYGPRAAAVRQRYLQARLNPQPPIPPPKPQVSSVRISRSYVDICQSVIGR